MLPLPALAYPVGFVVSNIIGKLIDHRLIQPQASRFRREESQLQHQFRLEELERQHELRFQELKQQQQARLQELKLQYEQSITKSFIDSAIRIQELEVVEKLRSSYSISTKKAITDLARKEANCPFYDGIEITRKNLKALYEQTELPIILPSPFWDDSKSETSNEQGGHVDFRTAFNSCYRQASWNNLASKEDGYFKRPLFKTDRDVNYIYSVLSDIPVILVHGTIQGVHSPHQQVQRIHPHITFWNLLPGEQKGYTSLDLRFFPLQIPVAQGNAPNIYQQMGTYSLDLQDNVGKYLTKAIGLLSAFYHLYYFGTRPDLQQFQLESEYELEVLSQKVEIAYEQYEHYCQLLIKGIIPRDDQGDTLF